MKKAIFAAGVATLALVAITSAALTTNLTVGSRGADVTTLQNWLISHNFSISAGATGYFGSQTKAALAAYQTSVGLPAFGFFGPLTQAKINGGAVGTAPSGVCPAGYTCTANVGTVVTTTPGAISTVGAEGNILVKSGTSVTNNSSITATSKVNVYALNIKAQNSDVSVTRVDLKVAVAAGANTLNPSSFIRGVSLLDGSNVILSKSLTSNDFSKDTSANVYYLRLTGFNFVVAKDANKDLVVAFDVNPLTSGDTDKTVTISGYGSQSVRAIDGAGISQYADATGLSRVQTFTVSGTSALTVTSDPITPKSVNYKVRSTEATGEIVIGTFNVKSTTGDSKITTIVASTTGLASANVYLYDGSTRIGAESGGAAATFSDLSVIVPKDGTKTLTVKVSYAATSTIGSIGNTTGSISKVVYETPDGTANNATVSSVNFYPIYVYGQKVSAISLYNTPTSSYEAGISGVSSSTISGIINVKIAADGANVTKPVTSDFEVVFATSTNAVDIANASALSASDYTITVNPNQDISDGTYAVVTINANMKFSGSNGGYYNLVLRKVSTNLVANQTWGLQDFYAPSTNLK